MYNTKIPLTCIPERDEDEASQKWVSKNKHEVLKAKYKCLKKLFEIYDANIIGAASDHMSNSGDISNKKSVFHVSAGTSENTISIRNVHTGNLKEEFNKNEVLNNVESNYTQPSVTKIKSVEIVKENKTVQEINKIGYINDFYYEKRRLSKLQIFIHRLFGFKYKQNPNEHILAASDNNIIHNVGKGNRRRGLRLRRRKQRKSQSESKLQDLKKPDILKYVQSVQTNCLLDTTPRYCPISGCKDVFYGIINYNDHLNLCHFTEKKFCCHYCHEGFEKESAKLNHENEHLGLPKLNLTVPYKGDSLIEIRRELSQDKLKKIVSFFDKIIDKHKFSNIYDTQEKLKKDIDSGFNLHKSKSSSNKNLVYNNSTINRDVLKCNICEESFDNRRQLGLHVELEHNVHNKFSKFHSCAGFFSAKSIKKSENYDVTEDGAIIQQSADNESIFDSVDKFSNVTSSTFSEISKDTQNFKPYVNKVNKNKVSNAKTRKDSGTCNLTNKKSIRKCAYKWEPGTKIIYV